MCRQVPWPPLTRPEQLLELPRLTQEACYRLVNWVWFDRLVLLLIAANCVVLAAEGPQQVRHGVDRCPLRVSPRVTDDTCCAGEQRDNFVAGTVLHGRVHRGDGGEDGGLGACGE